MVDSKEAVSSAQQDDIHMNSETEAAHIKSVPVPTRWVPALKGGNGHGLSLPNQEAICNRHPLAKGKKSVFST